MQPIASHPLLYLNILYHMLIEAFFVNLNLTTALITSVRIEVNKFRNLFWPSATVAPMTTGGTAFRTVNLRICLYAGLEDLTQH